MTVASQRYESAHIVVEYDARRCIHAAECVRGLPAVFDPKARPWIRLQNASGADVVAIVGRCPTGALTVQFKDGSAAERPDTVNTVTITADGPLYLRGRIAHAGAEYTRAALCRCGASANKPFCDNSHQKAGFKDAGACNARARDKPAAPQAPIGTILLKPVTNGPMMIEGWLELRAADGATLVVGDKCWLCRCGHSHSKPFCDGSHKTAGFTG